MASVIFGAAECVSMYLISGYVLFHGVVHVCLYYFGKERILTVGSASGCRNLIHSIQSDDGVDEAINLANLV